jgi:hypothetical protein
MSRPRRYPIKIEFWSTPEQLAGLELLSSDGLTDKSFHLRQALQMYLRATGAAEPRPMQNHPQMNGAA